MIQKVAPITRTCDMALYSTWHLVPHIRYEILEVAPVLFHALSFTYQSGNKSIMYQNSVVIPRKAIFMIYYLRGSTGIQYQEYSNQEMWDSRDSSRGFKRWPPSLGHVMWYFVPCGT